MPYGMYISAEGAMAQSRRLEVIANNLANVDTSGFKRDLALFQARYAQAIDDGLAQAGAGSVNDLGGGIRVRATATEFEPGPLEHTGRPSDVALDGPGFFTVRKGNETLLTRAGNFSVRETGELVTADGYSVLDDSGGPVEIDTTRPFRINEDGAVEQGGGVTFVLGLVQPRALADLSKSGENFFRPLAPTVPLEPDQRHVKAGYVEQSSVKPTSEMMAMIETSRAFEANVNMIRTQEQLLGTLIGRVLRA